MERIEKAIVPEPAGSPAEIKLVACSKERLNQLESGRAFEAGISILGGDYVQEAQKKIETIGKPIACIS